MSIIGTCLNRFVWHYSGTMSGIGNILLVKPGEGRQVSFFVVLLVCLGTGMAIGRGSADVLFLKRYGIEYLPVMYLILSLTLAACFTLYAAFVDRISSERSFYILLSIEVLALLGFWLVATNSDIELVYPAYFVFYELVSELMLVHATFYIAQNLDARQSKRLTSLILAGYQGGMIIGGVFFATMMPSIGVEHSMLVWSALTMLSIMMLALWHVKHGVPAFFIPPSKIGGRRVQMAVKEVVRGLQFVRRSSLLKSSSYALFFMVLTFYVLTYSVNKIYSESFESEEELAMFFGVLVASTNLLAVFLQAFVSGRVVEEIGVRKSKLIYPIMTIVSYVLLLISPGFYMALVASVNNASVMPAFRNPTRQMFFNVLPDYMKGRARATSVALVLPLALFVCGALVLYLQTSENPTLIIYLGFFCALMYLLFCYRMGKVYSTTLIENLKDKLYLPENISDSACRGSSETLYPVLLDGLNNDNARVCYSYAELLLMSFPDKAIEPIMRRIATSETSVADQLIRLIASKSNEPVLTELLALVDVGDGHLKATIYDVVLQYGDGNDLALIKKALSDNQARIRAAGIQAALKHGSSELYSRGIAAWFELLEGDWKQRMSVINMQPLVNCVNELDKSRLEMVYAQVFVGLLDCEGDARRAVIYQALAQWPEIQSSKLIDLIKQDLKSIDPDLRRAATSCLHLFADDHERKALLWLMLADGHARVRETALKVKTGLYNNPKAVCIEWLMQDETGTPRAQKVLLEALIEQGAEKDVLRQIADKKAGYAAELLSAMKAIGNDQSNQIIHILLEERLKEMIDLVLVAIEPVMAQSAVAVIRAGLSSKDVATVASAHEALDEIEDRKLSVLLSSLIDRQHDKTLQQGYGKEFVNASEVLYWCVAHGDVWLKQCGESALMGLGETAYA